MEVLLQRFEQRVLTQALAALPLKRAEAPPPVRIEAEMIARGSDGRPLQNRHLDPGDLDVVDQLACRAACSDD